MRFELKETLFEKFLETNGSSLAIDSFSMAEARALLVNLGALAADS
jgi:hypothetical protein